MTISAETRIGAIIKDKPEAIDVLISLSSHFKKLKNPILRKLLAPRVSIAEAAIIGNCDVAVILDSLAQIGFEVNGATMAVKENAVDNAIDLDETDLIASIDVRPDLLNGTDPFSGIMSKLSEMEPGNTLLVINSFEPAPLIRILKKKGYFISVTANQPGTVFTYITKTGDNAGLKTDEPIDDPDLFERIRKHYSATFTEIDVREMEMPKPMIAILDELDRLQSGEALYVRHKKIPLFLFPELKDRHFNYVLKQSEKEVILIIYNQE
jgi:uncharacterized protein (DUF2249 family)